MPGPSIRFDDVSLTLGGTPILQHVDLDVSAGSVHCVVGPNGGGKTSLVRSLLGQMPHHGDIRIEWSNNRTIGYVPQALEFDRNMPMTVDDFMAVTHAGYRPVFFGMSRYLKPDVGRVLADVGMQEKRKRPLGNLSGGERQRILFAQAMLPEPGLLILDEPMAGIDEDGAGLLLDRIQSLATGGTTILWIAHELDTVRNVADEITAIDGHVLFSGASADVADRLATDLLFRPQRTAV